MEGFKDGYEFPVIICGEETNLSFGAMMSLAHRYNWDSHGSSKWD